MNNYYYLGANPTVDIIVINPNKELLLIKRSENSIACPSQWALPGGFIDSFSIKGTPFNLDKEQPEQAALRELEEETNLKLPLTTTLTFLGNFEGNNRDPRDNELSWSKSFLFLYQIPKDIYLSQKDKLIGLDDAEEVKWFTYSTALNLELAFDHLNMLKLSKSYFK